MLGNGNGSDNKVNDEKRTAEIKQWMDDHYLLTLAEIQTFMEQQIEARMAVNKYRRCYLYIPSTILSPQYHLEVMERIKQTRALRVPEGTTLLYTTHYLEEKTHSNCSCCCCCCCLQCLLRPESIALSINW